ncbi:MAG TPA: hypothetical protein VGR92_08275 [Steroidobacteraceae bacterium]|nr:hypothetical protein [Steroidobacteraceae bacterium]
MGKSEFLEQDLIPAAQEKGYLTAYLNLWDARSYPEEALRQVLTQALAPQGWSKLSQRLRTPVRSVKAKASMLRGMAEGSLEAELDHDGAAQRKRALSTLIRGFNRPGKRLLLVLDEAQVLAERAHADLAHELRASLDSRKQSIKVVFAGSSETTLRRMFGRQRAPFYNWAPLEPFELLDAAFVRAMTQMVNRLSRFPLKESEALAAFDALKRTPEFFRRYLDRYLAYAHLGSTTALEHTIAHVFNDANFARTWGQLRPYDREVLKVIALGENTDLFSQRTRKKVSTALELPKVTSPRMMQASLQRLEREELVIRIERGEYALQDEVLLEWVRGAGSHSIP